MPGLKSTPPPRLRRIARLPLVSPCQWLRRVVFWVGAVLVATVAIGFALLADRASALFVHLQAPRPWIAFIVCPAGVVAAVLATAHVFPDAQGSGIPQVIAAQHMTDREAIARVLSLRVALGKVGRTLLGLACGASIGREGSTVQVGAAGVAAAFDTPLAGVVFAIEELGHAFESRTSGVVLTAVIIGGITTLALVGNYAYFGHTSAVLDFGRGWIAMALCSLAGGLAGGLFSTALVRFAGGVPGRLGHLLVRYPAVFAALCGLAIALCGVLSDGQPYGTGYEQACGMVEGHTTLPATYAALKFVATVLSYISGIPGDIFAPSRSVGAGLGQLLSHLMPSAPTGAVVLLGMVAYFSGVVQAPITAAVIVMVMTDNQGMTIPLLATSFLAFGVSRLVCRRPIYAALARRFLEAQAHSQ
jgi:H+/Cl- antiporter ClcA